MKEAYINFLNHCYIDTEVEMKEIYTSHHIWTLFEKSFLVDIAIVANSPHDKKHADSVRRTAKFAVVTLAARRNVEKKRPYIEVLILFSFYFLAC